MRCLLMLILASAVACGRPPVTGPTPGSPIARLAVHGPASIEPAPRGQGQFTAVAIRVDGSQVDVTATAAWSTSPGSVLQPTTTPGLIRGALRGEGDVTARYVEGSTTVTADQRVLVLEAGTFKVTGQVTYSATGGPLADARVEITSGTGRGLAAYTDRLGRYALYGAAGPITLTASLGGFAPHNLSLDVSQASHADFALAASSPPVGISGSWTIAFSASTTCRNNLPEPAREREFEAAISQEGAQATIALSGPTLIYGPWLPQPRPFQTIATVVGDRVSFVIVGDTGYEDWSYLDLYDNYAPDHWWGVGGILQGVATGAEIRATMNGDIEYWPGDMPRGKPTGICRAQDHTVILRRR